MSKTKEALEALLDAVNIEGVTHPEWRALWLAAAKAVGWGDLKTSKAYRGKDKRKKLSPRPPGS